MQENHDFARGGHLTDAPGLTSLPPAISRRDIVWGYAAHFLNISAALILLPLVVRFLYPHEVGLWFVFLALASFAQLLELGFQPTIARNAAYVYSGAQGLRAVGLMPASAGATVNTRLLADLVASAQRVYLGVAASAAIILVGAGSAYVYSLLPPDYAAREILLGWLAFSIGYVINLLYGFYNGLLQGRGEITAANKAIVASRLVLVICGALGLVYGFGLLGLGVASLCSSVVGRFLVLRFFFSEHRPETAKLRAQRGLPPSLVGKIWHNASRLGLVNVAAFLVLRSSVLIASGLLGLEAAASYGLSVQLLLTLSAIASMFMSLQLPRMNALQMAGRREALRRAFGGALLSAWATYSLGALLTCAYGPSVLVFIGSHTPLITSLPLACLALVLLLEMNHSISASYLTTLNIVPFVGAALWSGVAMVSLSIALVATTELGVWGLVLSQGIVQGAYNNWKWPKTALASLGCTFGELMRSAWLQLGFWIRGAAR